MQNLADHKPPPDPPLGELFPVHTLFVDVVGYSRLKIEQQRRVQGELRALFDATPSVQRALRDDRLIRRPTGDGMAVLFRANIDHTAADAVRCALAVDRALRLKQARQSRGEFSFRLRMGIHSGDVCGETDVNGTLDVAGDGIIYGQRVMDCGDGGHILLSAKSALLLRQTAPELAMFLGDLGMVRIKNDQLLHVYSLYGISPDETPFGNEALPKAVANSRKAQAQRDAEARARERRDAASEQWGGARRSVWLVLGMCALLILTHNILLYQSPVYLSIIRAREHDARQMVRRLTGAAAARVAPRVPKTRPTVSVPDFSTTGHTFAEAVEVAKEIGLDVRKSPKPGYDFMDGVEAGQIYTQWPEPHTGVEPGSVIYVRISRGPKPVVAPNPTPTPKLTDEDQAVRVDKIWSPKPNEPAAQKAERGEDVPLDPVEDHTGEQQAPVAAPPETQAVPALTPEPCSGRPCTNRENALS